jgi:hypothetical protein
VIDTVPMKLGNAGGGKGPDFCCAFEEGEVKVIGDEPANTDYQDDREEIALFVIDRLIA